METEQYLRKLEWRTCEGIAVVAENLETTDTPFIDGTFVMVVVVGRIGDGINVVVVGAGLMGPVLPIK